VSSIDERVVRVTFDNRQFEQGIASTLASLEKLTNSLKLAESTKGLSGVAANQRASLKNIEDGVTSLADRFTALGRIATGALESIGQRALFAGQQLVKALTFEPVISGFKEYETNINSIQTILANTQAAGTTLKDVNATLQELNHYSDQTIYNFSEMAKNIGTFTAAGVDLKTSTAAIKGIANLAALSGSNSMQASTAMYQLSQAISAGRVSLEDWNSVVNAGMGGTVFQRALAMNAEKMGTLSKGAVTLKGEMQNVSISGKSFRESITAKPGEKSWLTSEVLTRTLSQFTGDLTDAQLAAQGFSKAQIKAIQDQAAMAKSAATEVKTLSQLFGTFREQAGSGWAKTWEIIFGDFTEAKGLFTGVANSIGGILQASSDSRNKMLSDWKELGGRTVLIEAISNAFNGLMSVLKPIGQAFRQIFPAKTGKDLLEMTKNFRDFTEKLKIGSETADKLRRVFAGVFAIFDFGWEVIKGIVGIFAKLIGLVIGGSGDFLTIAANVGDFIVRLREAVARGDDLGKFFEKLGNILAIPIKLMQTLRSHILGLFDGFNKNGTEAADSVINFSNQLSPLGRAMDILASGGDKLDGMFDRVLDKLFGSFGPLLTKTREFFSTLGEHVVDALESVFGTISFEDVVKGINTGLLAALVLSIRNIFGGGAGNLFESVTDAFDQLTDTLGAMQNTLRAATLLQIAAAVGILTLSADKLSKIDSEGLKKALAALVGMLVQLLAAMAVMGKIGMAGFITISFGMILLATAVSLLTIAVKELSELDWKELAKGLAGTAGLLISVSVAAKIMSGATGLIPAAISMVILAGALKILFTVVQDFSTMNWGEIAKGLTGVAALLLSLGLFTRIAATGKGAIASGLGILILAGALKVLVTVVEDFAKMSWGEIGKGLTVIAAGLILIGAALNLIPPSSVISAAGVLLVSASLLLISEAIDRMGKMQWKTIGKGLATIGAALLIIAGALKLLPPSSLLSAAAILVVAASLQLIARALESMGGMSLGEIAKGLITLAGALAIIAIGVNAMVGALAGAAALLIVSASLLIMVQVLQGFASMSWEEILKGFVMMTGIFIAFAAAGILLGPLVPVLMALGVAITLLGVGILAAGAGTLLFATALGALAVAGTAATAALIAMVSGLLGLIPLALEMVGKGLVAFAQVIATAGPAIVAALVTILNALIDAINTLAPKIIDALLRLLLALLQKMAEHVPKMVDAGMRLITGILRGIADNVAKLVDAGTDVIVNFLQGIAKNLPSIIAAAFILIIAFINGLANAIRDNSAKLAEAGVNLASALIEGIIRGLAAGLQSVVNKAVEVVKSAYNAAKSFLGISSPSKEFHKLGAWSAEGMANGLDKNAILAEKSGRKLGEGTYNALKTSLSRIPDLVSSELDTTHTITPVLDLSSVKKDSNQIKRWMAPEHMVSIATTMAKARAAAFGYQSNQDQLTESVVSDAQNGSNLTFIQNNTSPKALSSAEIYRQTKNQLSIAKEDLPV
jgi:tape measure domain-containing protein